MRNIVKGNDINILWDIVRKINGQDEPYDLTGRNLSLYLVTPLGQDVIEDFTTQGNTIIWTFKGMDQKVLGVYSLKLVINESQPYMQTVDECNVLRLVEHSCMAGGHDDEGIKVETISLIAHIDVAAIIPDTSLNANSQNVVTNAAITQGLDAMHQELSQDIESSTAVINNEVKAVKQELSTINASKANTFGRYPGMSVGFSDDLVGRGESVPAEFSFRASGGKSIKDGAARIKRLKGNSVVWNNMVDTRGYEAGFLIREGIKIQQGHKYLLQRSAVNDGLYLIPVVDGSEKYEMGLRAGEYSKIYTSQYTDLIDARVYCESYCGACVVSDLTLMFGAGNEPTTIEEYNARKPIVADEYAYNEGEVIHMNTESIKSVGDNAWDEEWEYNGSYVVGVNSVRVLPNTEYYVSSPDYVVISVYDKNDTLLATHERKNNAFTTPANASYLRLRLSSSYGTTYNNDIMISLVHSGWKVDTDAKYQPYWEDRLMFDKRIKDEFPNGMSKWDMVYNKNGKGYIVHGLGVEDMGNMSWWYDNQDGNMVFISWGISDLIKKPSAAETNKGALSAKYSASSSLTAWNMSNMTWVLKTDGAICIDDEKYNDAESFKAAMAGVPLFYQLAEPTIIEYDEPFNLDYKVADFGTEEIIAPQPSAPFSADIIYQFNAVDMIREHELEITELQRIIAIMQAQLTSLTNR